MRRLATAVLASGLLLAACGGGSGLTEYADQLESAVTDMNARLDELDAQLPEDADLDEVKHYADERLEARNRFVGVLEGLEPPDSVRDLHIAAVGIMSRLTDAEAALAAYTEDLDTLEGAGDLWATPLGVAARSADAEAIELCLAAEQELDTTERSELEGVPWIPPELKEVVQVAFGCVADQR